MYKIKYLHTYLINVAIKSQNQLKDGSIQVFTTIRLKVNDY